MTTTFLIASGLFLAGGLILIAVFAIDPHSVIMEVDPDINLDSEPEISSVYICADGSVRDVHTHKEVIFN